MGVSHQTFCCFKSATNIRLLALEAGGGVGGTTYTAGDGIEISGLDVISVDIGVGRKGLPLAQFAAGTTSLEMRALITNPTGTGSLVFQTNPTLDGPKIINGIVDSFGTKIVDFAQVGGAANWVQFTNSAATIGPTISPEGSDTNIDLNLAGKGTGKVRVPTATPGTNTTQAASTAFVNAAITAQATPIGLNLALISGNYLN